ncbi:MAG: hypothetical protein JXR95_04470 [Deltaproteobacteria bacterium]|nr:hypothetical protein [Deltaproteobacteria bacterium]
MRHLFRLTVWQLVLVVAFIFQGCDDSSSSGPKIVSVDDDDKALFSSYFPDMQLKKEIPVPAESLEENIIEPKDASIVCIYDEFENVMGYVRHVKTGVGCHDKQCSAIQFDIVFDSQGEFLDIFHEEGTTAPFMKGIPDNTSDSIPFTEDDMTALKGFMANPPSLLLNLDDRLDMVDDLTGATFEAYVGSVVADAAYTTYTCLEYVVNTQLLIQTLFADSE